MTPQCPTGSGAMLPPATVLDRFAVLADVPIAELTGPAQTRGITRLRHEAAYLIRIMTTASLAQIGRILGGRDQTTIDTAIDKVTGRLAESQDYREYLGKLMARINAPDGGRAIGSNRLAALRGVLADAKLNDHDARAAALQIVEGLHVG